jgi:hypothetical protein
LTALKCVQKAEAAVAAIEKVRDRHPIVNTVQWAARVSFSLVAI